MYHYTNELKAEFGRYSGKCVHCKTQQKGGSFISHMGQVHNEVEKYLPDVAKIPASVQVILSCLFGTIVWFNVGGKNTCKYKSHMILDFYRCDSFSSFKVLP